jgi:pimeloyl-ACP methyl ester carboxylesterase
MRIGRRTVAATAILVAATLAAAGCKRHERDYISAQRLESGLVVSLDGIGGYNWGPQWLRSGLEEAGVSDAIVIYDWSKGPGGMWLGDLMDGQRNQGVARDLADLLATYIAATPGRPVTLIGHSGGAAVVAWALEHLPAGMQVERAILMAPALAPDYDLTTALKGVRHRLYVMHSPGDVGLLAAGTAVFGTMDRKHGVSAGLVGFRLPENSLDAYQYTKIRQVAWTLDLVKSGHLGGHMGWTTTRFARDFIAPIISGTSDPGQPLAVVRDAPAAKPQMHTQP